MLRLPRATLCQPDGRQVYLYGGYAAAPADYRAPVLATGVWQQRWNPLRQEWVLVASGRQGRTFLPERSTCPLCPSTDGHSSEIPAARFEVAVFENRFPAMRTGVESGSLTDAIQPSVGMRAKPSAGSCEVIVYSDQHEGSFGTLAHERLIEVVEVWTDRYRELGARPGVRYVFVFENRGEAVGVTLHHPHGQIFGYPFVPPVPDLELRAGRAFRRRRRQDCLHCALITAERQGRERLLFEEAGVVAYVPAYARWPYEVHVAPWAHRSALPDLSMAARAAFGVALQRVARAYDRLFDTPMPYMMAIHQRPTDGGPHPQAHLHAEFYPVLRDAGKLKYLAGSETAAGVFVNDTLAEEKAAVLRRLL